MEGVDRRVSSVGALVRRREGPGAAAEAPEAERDRRKPDEASADEPDIDVLVTQTLAGLERTSDGPVLASTLKRTILRKDPTFNEADHGFRGFGELLRHLANSGVVDLSEGSAQGDPEVHFPQDTADEDASFALLRSTVERLRAPKARARSTSRD